MRTLTLAALLLVACDDEGGGGGTADRGSTDGGSMDGSRLDAARDAGRDAAPDAARPDAARPDAARPDAAVDAGADAARPDGGPECAEEGEPLSGAGAQVCCAGLVPIGCERLVGPGQCSDCDGDPVCARCGDGACGVAENPCNCPADCMEPACAGEGESVPVVPGAPPCCEGLAPIGCDQPEQGVCPGGCVGASICARCGDGQCGPGENLCNCPADCAEPACAGEGESVPVVPGAPPCCEGLAPIGCDRPGADGQCPGGCDGASICARCGDGQCGPGENLCNCPADCAGVVCAGEGESVPVVPGAPECCAGLAPIGCERPDRDGVCSGPCVGATICASCGDGQCGAGENLCNCPADCRPAGECRNTSECLDHPAPIRCLGAWRCDPNDVVPSDHQGDDGCNYTCLFNLPACSAREPCPEGSRCAPCPVEGACNAAQACRALDDLSCRNAGDCVGLPAQQGCPGAYVCSINRCQWSCNE